MTVHTTTRTASVGCHAGGPCPPRPRILYGSVFAWHAIVGGRFMAPFLRHEAHFIKDTLIGLVFSVGMLIMTIVSPWSGAMADYYEDKKPGRGRTHILGLGVVLGSFVFMCHGIQHVFPSRIIWKSIGWHFSLRLVYAVAFPMTLPVLDGITLAHLEATTTISRDASSRSCVVSSSSSPKHPNVDEIYKNTNDSKEEIENDNNNNNNKGDNSSSSTTSYGKERLHGAIWWAITNLVLGPCLDRWGFQVLYGFAIVSTVVCVWCIAHYTLGQPPAQISNTIDFTSTSIMPNAAVASGEDTPHSNNYERAAEDGNTRNVENPDLTVASNQGPSFRTRITKATTTVTKKVSMTRLFKILLGTLYGCSFLVFFTCLRIGTSVVDQMAFLYFEYLQSTYWMCSITVVLTVIFEIPIFHWAPTFLEKWGPGTLQIVAGVAYVTRVVGYTLVPTGRMVYIFVLEPLHGVTYACAQASSVEFVSQLMPTGYEASGQGILRFFGGLGGMVGLLAGGWMEEYLGPRIMYRLLALVVLIGMAMFVMASIIHEQQEDKTQQRQHSSSSLSSAGTINKQESQLKARIIIPLQNDVHCDEEYSSLYAPSGETAPLLNKTKSKQNL